MSISKQEAAQSALYHIDAIDRRLRMLRQMINPDTGAVTESSVMAGLMLSAEDEMLALRDDVIRLL